MITTIPTTDFAPAKRIPIEVVQRQAATVAHLPLTSTVLNSVLNYVFVLNPQRQIVFASHNWSELLPGKKPQDLLGLRPGEALGCIHAHEREGGCGTSKFCEECGAVKAILGSLAGRQEKQECHLTRVVNCQEQALDLLVYSSPFPVNGETYSLFAVVDISHENRRRALERIFFHDVLNSAGGLESLTELLTESVPKDLHEDIQLLHDGLHDLYDQVQSQKDLAAAENKELTVTPIQLNPDSVLQEVVRLYQKHLVAKGRQLEFVSSERVRQVTSDLTLLKRVLGNLIKNALEAAHAGQTVTTGYNPINDGAQFWVHNPGFMTKEVQLQVFSRSFTTKGLGRGLGTYSVKLLAEQYLQGRVSFVTDPDKGTTFYVEIPNHLSQTPGSSEAE